MAFGLRALLLIVAMVLFIIAWTSNTHWSDYIAVGLACTAAALLVEELGLNVRLGGRRR